MCVGFLCFCYSTFPDHLLRKISLPSTWISHFWFIKFKRDSAASCLAAVSGGRSFFFHSGSCCGQTHPSQEHYRTKDTWHTFWRQQTWLIFKLWVLWNVYLGIWYVQNQQCSARSFRLVWQLGTPSILPPTISAPDKGVSSPPGNSCTSLVPLLFLKGKIQSTSKASKDAKNDWEKDKEKGGEKWYEKTKGKNTQCAKASELSTCQMNCVVDLFLIFLA